MGDKSKDDAKKNGSSGSSSGSSDSSFRSSSSVDSSITAISFDENRFIWSREELDYINKKRSKGDIIPVVYRDTKNPFGIRANTEMTFTKCCYSLILPWHNDWVNIFLYLGFAFYFWLQLIFIMAKYKLYELDNDIDWLLMFIATLGIAISLTLSAVYLTFYPISAKVRDTLEAFNFQGILLMAYCLIFVLIATEWAPRQPVGFYFLFLTTVLLMSSLILVQYDKLKVWILWITVGYGILILLIDLFGFVNKR